MAYLIATLGAVALTYLGGLLFSRLTRIWLQPRLAVVAAHLLSFLTIAAFVSTLKAFQELVREDAAFVYILPQLAWLIVDLVALKRERPARR